MSTCEEAVALFAEHKGRGPWGECPQGHQEAAFEYMMYGVRPSEPCPRCGEIPEFSSPSMSLNFYSEEPVKEWTAKTTENAPSAARMLWNSEGTVQWDGGGT